MKVSAVKRIRCSCCWGLSRFNLTPFALLLAPKNQIGFPKVTVHFRNVDADADFAIAKTEEENLKAKAAKAAFDKLTRQEKKNNAPDAVPAAVRKGFKCVSFEGTTVSDLKDYVLKQLDKQPFDLKVEHIQVFTKGTQLDPIMGDPAKTDLIDGGTYFAVEVFHEAPADMLRTVRLDELKFATLCLSNRRKLTHVSPLKTAAMSFSEVTLPWHHLCDGELHVRGIPVFCRDTAIEPSPFNPFTEMQNMDVDTTYSLPLNEYQKHLLTDEQQGKGVFGILETSTSHEMHRGFFPPKIKSKSLKVNKKKSPGPATEQVFFFRFVLKKGTDLRKHGMAVVYDNMGNSEGHCSLIRYKEAPGNQRPWKYTNPHGRVVVPDEFDSSKSPSDAELDKLLSPRHGLEQPETIFQEIAGIEYLTFPCLAAEYELHDFAVKARAEPLPLDEFDDLDAQSMYHAALVLFSTDCIGEDVYDALRVLESAHYAAKFVDSSTRKTLLQAMESVDVPDWKEIVIDADIEPSEALLDGVDILRRTFQEDEMGALTRASLDMSISSSAITATPHKAQKDGHAKQETPSPQTGTGAAESGDTPESHSTNASRKENYDSLLPAKSSSSNETDDPLQSLLGSE